MEWDALAAAGAQELEGAPKWPRPGSDGLLVLWAPDAGMALELGGAPDWSRPSSGDLLIWI